MMDSQRSSDFQATNRIFRKVVHPGLDSLRLVDKNGMPITTPLSSMKQKMFILSPRGVPTRVTNHVYSGQPMRMSRPYSEGLSHLEKPDYYNENSYDPPTYRTTQSVSPYSSKRSANYNRGGRQMAKAKSASSRGYLSSVADEKRYLQSASSSQSSRWNTSSQGLRLEKEWTDLANSRSLKRNSEIVSHRVDRMYFMTGNSINIKPKYHVDDEELKQLRELSKSRQSSRRQNRCAHFMEPCVEEESVCPEPSVIEEEETMGSEDELNQIAPNINHSKNHSVQSMVLEGTSEKDLEIQKASQNQYEEVPDNVEDEGGYNMRTPNLLQRNTGSVVSSSGDPECGQQSGDMKIVSPEEGEVIEQEKETDQDVVYDGSSKSMRNNADEVDENLLKDPSSEFVESNDTTDLKLKPLSPNLSHISKESGIQIDQEFNEELPSQEPSEPRDSEKEHEWEDRIKFTHWIVDFDDVSVADLLAHGEKNIIGECMTTLLKDFYAGVKKPRFEYKTGIQFQQNLKKKVVKKPKICKNKEKGPCIETPVACKEGTYFKKFPNRKASHHGYNRLHQMPVKCGCRENKGNLNSDLFIEGTPVPIYKLVDDTMEEFKLHYL
ncbi:uncharacterized protein LOC133197659 isoform X2 [Saccostrea echinata]|uniref:uncharacterized protein LOC133197659 isoform X2 n=1 Tax=Saccostrea echinata TaxID=191078 RepID=UPI002A82E54D|nr:uncharacterized protein LOC133197659 isoform X2 [Saccostrea echinata]